MRYVLAILLPPLAMFFCGKVIQAIFCLILMLTLIGWPVASIWALLVVHDHNEKKRNEELMRAIERGEVRDPRAFPR